MKNRTNFLGIIALVAIIGFVGVSCGSDSDFGAPGFNIPEPNLSFTQLPTVPGPFFEAANVGTFVQVNNLARAEMAYESLRPLVAGLVGDFGSFINAETPIAYYPFAVGSRTFNWGEATLTEDQVEFLEDYAAAISREAAARSGSFTINVSGSSFMTANSTGSINASSSGVRFQVSLEDALHATVAYASSGSWSWNPTRENINTSDGFTAVVAFVVTNAVTGTDLPSGFYGRARIRSGDSRIGDGPRGFMAMEDEALRVVDANSRMAHRSSLQIQFLGPSGDEILHTFTRHPTDLTTPPGFAF